MSGTSTPAYCAADGPVHLAIALENIAQTAEPAASKGKASSGRSSIKAVLEGLEELWDQHQYEEEFSLESFTTALKK